MLWPQWQRDMTLFENVHIADDPMTLVLLGLFVLLVGLPSILLGFWVISRPPFRVSSLRRLYLAWACVLAGASVWSLSRDPLLAAEEAGANNFIRLAFLLLGALVMLLVGARYRFFFIREVTSGLLGIFSVFALWGLASTLWSVSPLGTLYKSIEYITMLALFALVASSIMLTLKEPRQWLIALKGVFDWHWFLLFLLMVSVYVGVIVLPEYAILRDYRDQTGVLGFSIQGALPGLSANAVGTLGAIMGVVAVVRLLLMPRLRILWIALLLVSLLTMVLTQSRSPILAFLVAVVVVLVMSRRFGLLIASGALLGTASLAQYGQLMYEFMTRGQNEQNLTSLTGRVTRWQASFEAIREQPLVGYGANAGGRVVLESALGEVGVDVHNTFVEVLLDTGVVGLVLLVAGLVATWFWMFKVYPHATASPIGRLLWFESVGVLSVLSVRSMFAVTLVWSWYVLNLGVVLVFLSVMRRQIVRVRHAGAASAQLLPAARRRRSSIRG
jgi:O-antigen ligase